MTSEDTCTVAAYWVGGKIETTHVAIELLSGCDTFRCWTGGSKKKIKKKKKRSRSGNNRKAKRISNSSSSSRRSSSSSSKPPSQQRDAPTHLSTAQYNSVITHGHIVTTLSSCLSHRRTISEIAPLSRSSSSTRYRDPSMSTINRGSLRNRRNRYASIISLAILNLNARWEG